jgi:nicotinate-nucleotide pyrophosphorylase (carboxylating)
MTVFTPTPHVDALIELALAEDIGCGDVTSEALIPATATAEMVLLAKSDMVFCGAPIVDRLLWRYGPMAPTVKWAANEGDRVEAGTVVARLRGLLQHMLIVERPLLNFLQRLSGVATHTRRFVDRVEGTHAHIVDTRKTLPGYRALDKYATRVGGARNHRAGLDGGILIKDNHLAAAGGIAAAVATMRAVATHTLRVEVEVETLDGLDAALAAGADVIMLDNFTPEAVCVAVERAGDAALIEASGGIDLETVRAFAEAGVDIIAVGALTHSAPAVDISAEIIRG